MWRLTFKVAEVQLIAFCCFVSINVIAYAEVHHRNTGGNRRIVTDPVSNFFSELGDVFLDIDRSLAVQTAPKVQYEDDLVAEVLRPSREYFDDVQKNYRALQKRFGASVRKSIGPKYIVDNNDHSTVSPLAMERGTSSSTLSLDRFHKKTGSFEPTEKELKGSLESQRSSAESGNVQNDCSIEILEDPLIDAITREKCSRILSHRDNLIKLSKEKIFESKPENEFIPLNSELDRLSYSILRKSGDAPESDSKAEGRIIGDVLNSESLFDKHIRQLLKDHGKWILDNPFLARWRSTSQTSTKDDSTTETSEVATVGSTSDLESEMGSTQAYMTTAESETEYPKTKKTSGYQATKRSSDYYRIVDNNGIIEEEVDIVLNPLSKFETDESKRTNEIKKSIEPKESVILAFTPTGVPLKLRMGPEIENPVRFLHKVLKSAGVSLNVPVESYNDIEPVGKEVMKFGTGVLTRAVYFNLSNSRELKSLLKTLMTSKAQGKIKF